MDHSQPPVGELTTHRQHSVTEFGQFPTILHDLGRCVCVSLLQLVNVFLHFRQIRHVTLDLVLLTLYAPLKVLKSDHGHGNEFGRIRIVFDRLSPHPRIDAFWCRVQVLLQFVLVGQDQAERLLHTHVRQRRLCHRLVKEVVQFRRRNLLRVVCRWILLLHVDHHLTLCIRHPMVSVHVHGQRRLVA